MKKKDRAVFDSAKVNQYAANMLLLNRKLADALSELLGSCELNMDDMEPETLRACANARVLIAQLKGGA